MKLLRELIILVSVSDQLAGSSLFACIFVVLAVIIEKEKCSVVFQRYFVIVYDQDFSLWIVYNHQYSQLSHL